MKYRPNFSDINPQFIRRAVSEKNHEEFICDDRDRFRPSELIQHKLQLLTPAHRLAVSHFHAGRNLHRPDAPVVH